jgi:glutamine amidotransferase
MCIAILNVTGTLSKESIINSWDNNYHGAGFAYSDGARIVVHKEDKDKDKFYKAYAKHRKKHVGAKFLIHFRISTHGTITKDNLHPFVINDDVALIHNGMVDFAGHKASDKRSDTRYLCEEFLSKMPKGWHLAEGVHNFISEVGGYSKFVMLDIDNNHAIINEDSGHWFEDNWYSNSSYKTVSNYIDYGGKKVAKGGSSSYDSLYDSSYGKPYVVSDSVPFYTLKSIESVLAKEKLSKSGRMVYSAYIDKDYSDMGKAIDGIIEDNSKIEENVWYHLPESKKANQSYNAICWVTVNGTKFSVVSLNGYDGTESMTALPFAIRNEEMLCAYLAILDDGNHTMTKTDKLIDTLEKCYHLYDEATEIINSFNWMDDNKSLDAKGYCDCCDAIVSKKDLSPMDGAEHWNCCTNCNLSTFSYN